MDQLVRSGQHNFVSFAPGFPQMCLRLFILERIGSKERLKLAQGFCDHIA